MTDDLLEKFLKTQETSERLRFVKDPKSADVLTQYLGAAAFGELKKMADAADTAGHLSRTHAPNIVFVPGVMGSLLSSIGKSGVWWIDARNAKHLDDLCLSEDGSTDRDADADVQPFNVDQSYEPFLTAALARNDFGHMSFPYDWRKSLRRSADAFVDRVRDSYKKNNNRPVHVVAHSMGGVMVRTALLERGKDLWPMVDRIVFIGTPHHGAAAIAGYLKNHLWGFEMLALVGTMLTRPSFRSMWGVLGLLPAPVGVYLGTRPGEHPQLEWGAHPCASFDMYDAKAWDLDLTSAEEKHLQVVLDETARLHRELWDAHKTLTLDQRSRMLMIAGVGYKTLFRLEYPTGLASLWKDIVKVVDRVPGDPHRDGDGRVPVASATLPGVAMRYVKGVHGGLTNIPIVYEGVFKWLNGLDPELATTPAQALSGHLSSGPVSTAPSLDGTVLANRFTDDPGYLDFEGPDAAKIAQYRKQLDTGNLPGFHAAKIF